MLRQKNAETMVNNALLNLNSIKGVTLNKIYSFIKEKYKIESLSQQRKNLIKNVLRSLHQLKELKNVTGRGLRGHMKLVNKQKFKKLVEKTNRPLFNNNENESESGAESSRDSVAYDLRNRSIIVHVNKNSQRSFLDPSRIHTVRDIPTLPVDNLSESTNSITDSNIPQCSTHVRAHAYKRKNNYTPPSASPIRLSESSEIHTTPRTPIFRTQVPIEQQRKRNQSGAIGHVDGETPRSSQGTKRRRKVNN